MLVGLTIMERPPFKSVGAWLACGALQVHLTIYPFGSFRTGNVDGDDCHFTFRTDDFDGALQLTARFAKTGEDDPMRVWSAHVPVSRSSSSSIPTATSSR